MQSRVSLDRVPGGDTIQVRRTQEALRGLGVEVDLSLELEPDLSGYDVVHLFNLARVQESYVQAMNARRQGKPVALSPIYWNYSEFIRNGGGGWRSAAGRLLGMEGYERAKGVWRYLMDGERNAATRALVIKGYKRLQRSTVEAADVLLPNSRAEAALIREDFGLPAEKLRVVVNGVDRSLFDVPEEQLNAADRDLVTCAARIETRKNQLNLVRALKGTGLKLLLVGNPAPNHASYFAKVRSEADGNVEFAGWLDQSRLRGIYARTRVHVLPSWFETPGLSSLEAAICGCNVVVTDRGSTREYFGDLAYYCEGDSPDSIRAAVMRAWEEPANPELRSRVRGFTWQKAASSTLEAYRLVCNGA